MDDLVVLSLRDGVRKILLNRPQKRNAFNPQMYIKVADTLNKDAQDDQVVLTIITGAGEFYSSGTELNMEFSNRDPPKRLVQALIDYPKLIIAVLNGPAIGIAATTLALCDIVYASDRAYISTPFVRLGLCAEGTSSYLFPRLLGRSKASELLFLNRQMSAREACESGLVARVIHHEELQQFIEGLYSYGTLPVNPVKVNKRLIMDNLRKVLIEVNQQEFEAVERCIESEEFAELMMKYMSSRSKL